MRIEANRGPEEVARGYLARRLSVLLAMVAMAVLVCSTAAFAAVQVFTGTDGNDRLVGTPGSDIMTGLAGNDTTIGKEGADKYRYSDGWGVDGVIDTGGIDTLNFTATTKDLRIALCPEQDPSEESPSDGGLVTVIGAEDRVVFDDGFLARVPKESAIENATGGSGSDSIVGCAGRNVLSGGGGTINWLSDFGGNLEFAHDVTPIPASNDEYRVNRFTSTVVHDFGGAADVLRIKRVTSEKLRMYRYDGEDGGTKANSLLLCHGGETRIVGQFGPEDGYIEDMQIESIILFDKTIHPEAASLSVAVGCRGEAIPE